jgi:hypothetical protein
MRDEPETEKLQMNAIQNEKLCPPGDAMFFMPFA